MGGGNLRMPNHIIDPTRFDAEGAIVDWTAQARRLGLGFKSYSLSTMVKHFQPSIQLRWRLHGEMGMPTEPFRVFYRPHEVRGVEQPLNFTQTPLLFLWRETLVTWSNGSMSTVSVDVQAPDGGEIDAFSTGPLLENICTTSTVPRGSSTIQLSSPVIDGLLVSRGITVTAVRGIETSALSQAKDWTLLELVGLPVELADWQGIGKHGTPQGLIGALVDAKTAAVQRLTRGAPPLGWGSLLSPTIPAPPWVAPDFDLLIKEINISLLEHLREIVKDFAPDQQVQQQIVVTLPPPTNSSGQQMNVDNSQSTISPLAMTLMAAGSDPFLILALGFGTAYPLGKTAEYASNARSEFDYMIVAHWEKGLDGKSDPIDYAAIVPAPEFAIPPPSPANMIAVTLGSLRPHLPDGNWRSSVRVGWDRSPDMRLFSTSSFAVARAGLTPSEPAIALLEGRNSGGLRPIAINSIECPSDTEFWRLHAIDNELEIPSDPGTKKVRYGAAIQDIYGQWTPWMTIDKSLSQPNLEPVRIVSVSLSPNLPAVGSICQANLEIEFLWDWRVRSPKSVRFAGRLYPAAERGSPLPSTTVPAGLIDL